MTTTNTTQNENQKSEYDIQAEIFVKKTGLEISKQYLGHYKRLEGAKSITSQWKITFTRKNKKPFVFEFSNSVIDSWGIKVDFKTRPLNQNDFKYVYVNRAIDENIMSNDIVQITKEPSDYSILACLQKYDVGTFEDFCGDFGYDTDSRKAEKIYFAVQKEYSELVRLFTEEELEELREIS